MHAALFHCIIGAGVIYEGPRPFRFRISYLIGGKGRDYPTSLHIRAKGPRRFEWIKKLHGVLRDIQRVMFRGLLDYMSNTPS